MAAVSHTSSSAAACVASPATLAVNAPCKSLTFGSTDCAENVVANCARSACIAALLTQHATLGAARPAHVQNRFDRCV